MELTQETCYMCSNQKSSREHAPPKCLFPELKDLEKGQELRKNLISVPSCDRHNSRKSEDDEYLLAVLTLNLPANETAVDHFSTKVIRSYQRKPALVNQLISTSTSIVSIYNRTQEPHETLAISIDNVRLTRVLEGIVRAIFFHHFSQKWLGRIITHAEFLLNTLDPEVAVEKNKGVGRKDYRFRATFS